MILPLNHIPNYSLDTRDLTSPGIYDPAMICNKDTEKLRQHLKQENFEENKQENFEENKQENFEENKQENTIKCNNLIYYLIVIIFILLLLLLINKK